MKNAKLSIIKSVLLGIIVFSIPFLLKAQQATEELPKELPKTFGTYLNSMEGLIKWEDMPLGHSELGAPTLEDWAAPKVKNVSGQELSIISYFALFTKVPENFKLYRLRTGYFKPSIEPSEEIELSVEPITGIEGLAGNMVRIIPNRVLTKGNYLFVEGDINEVNRCWVFTVDGGEEMWRTFNFWNWCSSCLFFWK